MECVFTKFLAFNFGTLCWMKPSSSYKEKSICEIKGVAKKIISPFLRVYEDGINESGFI